jgi:hypothetical protein
MRKSECEHHAARRERLAILSLFVGIAIIACSAPALAAWWIVSSSDRTCLVVDIEPKDVDKGVTKIGRDSYRTAEEAEADVKLFAKSQRPTPSTIAKTNQ